MKNSNFLLIILLFFSILPIGCKDYTEVIPVIRGTPGGGVTQSKVVNIQGNEITFEVNLFCVNHVGNFIENLETDVFDVTPVSGIDIKVISSDYVQQEYKGSYSGGMLFDQSGSIGTTDPNNARVDAGKAFVDLMGKKDEMALTRFSGVGNVSQYDLLSSFTNDKRDLKSFIDDFSDNQYGGTPGRHRIFL